MIVQNKVVFRLALQTLFNAQIHKMCYMYEHVSSLYQNADSGEALIIHYMYIQVQCCYDYAFTSHQCISGSCEHACIRAYHSPFQYSALLWQMEATEKSDISCKREKMCLSFTLTSLEYHDVLSNLLVG